MPWLKWYDPNSDGPHELEVCTWQGDCIIVQATPSAGCYVADIPFDGTVTGTLLSGDRTSPESEPVYVPEPSNDMLLLFGVAMIIGLMIGGRKG